MMSIAMGLFVSIPGVVMLNQELQFIPTNTFVTGVTVGETQISNHAIITCSLLLGLALLGIGAMLLLKSLSNWSHNQKFEDIAKP
ncbi:hypothetical protein LOC67_14725 [Stieleria sp. JC731]|uniref:hypothetical protein n=1 Tax=Pirellulaceae TaxID=2691357 RepID=UPI001E2E6D96|nr:hypothetical protein [Stieleria sp. JC731]MCC9601812.1 hypothetical protein [Stieleria sp. JC731]